MRDTLAHRGPDDAGLIEAPGLILASRRLAIRHPGPEGAQPMRTPDAGHTLVYNGELYNDDELREALAREGVRPAGACDTETLLLALATWGERAIERLRGMYAFAWVDGARRRLTLARDPLGIKPLYFWTGPTRAGATLVFASEIPAILAHPDVPVRPDAVGVSNYLTTIRTVIEDRTVFEGVRAVRTGEVLAFDLDAEPIAPVARTRRTALAEPANQQAGLPERVRSVVAASVRAHTVSDRPVCCLLSGGLDSSAVTLEASASIGEVRTYCAGAPDESPVDGVPQSDDFRFARMVSEKLGTRHTEAPVSRALFAERWPDMVRRTGLPLSTPNEVAIHEVARRLRAEGDVVALSGEGADELFGGYEGPLVAALEHVRTGDADPGVFQLRSGAWLGPEHKAAALAPEILGVIEGDAWLVETYRRVASECADDGPTEDPLQAHLRFHRRMNLTGLLQRLDSAMMLASVEGRTPLADIEVARLAEGLSMSSKFRPASEGSPASTKRALREAFAGALPADVVRRPKASFPLPFQRWVDDHAPMLAGSRAVRGLLSEAAVRTVARSPSSAWSFSWPMINLAMWAERWWGEG